MIALRLVGLNCGGGWRPCWPWWEISKGPWSGVPSGEPGWGVLLELFIPSQEVSEASSPLLSEAHCPVRQVRSELELASRLVVQQPATVDHVPAQ